MNMYKKISVVKYFYFLSIGLLGACHPHDAAQATSKLQTKNQTLLTQDQIDLDKIHHRSLYIACRFLQEPYYRDSSKEERNNHKKRLDEITNDLSTLQQKGFLAQADFDQLIQRKNEAKIELDYVDDPTKAKSDRTNECINTPPYIQGYVVEPPA